MRRQAYHSLVWRSRVKLDDLVGRDPGQHGTVVEFQRIALLLTERGHRSAAALDERRWIDTETDEVRCTLASTRRKATGALPAALRYAR